MSELSGKPECALKHIAEFAKLAQFAAIYGKKVKTCAQMTTILIICQKEQAQRSSIDCGGLHIDNRNA